MSNPKLSSCAIVLITPHIENAANYYREALGFRVVEHYEQPEKFAALYRDAVEIVLVQAQFGTVRSNRAQYGAGFDAYLVPGSPRAVDEFYEEIKARGAKIVQPPAMTAYGSQEFVLEDIDGRLIGVGCIQDEAVFFGGAA
jgi:uncharacterized glyoxalase superfamily protein PhnB